MKKIFVTVLLICLLMLPSIVHAADVKVMVALGFLSSGEDAPLMTIQDYYQSKYDGEKTTLKKMIIEGWSIVYMQRYGEAQFLIVIEKK